ncbi:ornithine cyclodeaminase family protein [Psychromonas arctica]|uniref:ornithine cyclodeaminase family protein n=1 Tax=Psychromonas arctica TaxID=168275 RepID=UPI0004146967|nr:ornithine cyclodeaminase [Psychromonas arctica]
MLLFINAEDVKDNLSWTALCDALHEGHQAPQADIDDILFKQGDNALLNRAAWIKGKGIGVKTATIFPNNANLAEPLPNVQAVFTLFDDETGKPLAFIDGNLVTKWKTAGDSVFAAKLLARPNSRVLTIIGAGAVASSMIDAYRALFPKLEKVQVWNRTFAKAQKLAQEKNAIAIQDLPEALSNADIVSSSTMSTSSFIKGEWIKAGTHVDLIGAYRPDMREADDSLLIKSRIFVDSRDTAIHDIGELAKPIKDGIIKESDVLADFYQLCNDGQGRQSESEITLFKNGGGAHLDLMTALYIMKMAGK